jgi:hypothetical protein
MLHPRWMCVTSGRLPRTTGCTIAHLEPLCNFLVVRCESLAVAAPRRVKLHLEWSHISKCDARGVASQRRRTRATPSYLMTDCSKLAAVSGTTASLDVYTALTQEASSANADVTATRRDVETVRRGIVRRESDMRMICHESLLPLAHLVDRFQHQASYVRYA